MTTAVLQTGGHILSRASGAVGNADTSYIYFALGYVGGYAALQWKNTVATTVTFEFSSDADSTSLDPNNMTAAQLNALNWMDRTTALTGAASQTTDGAITFDTKQAWRFGRVKLVTTNATNSIDLFYSNKN